MYDVTSPQRYVRLFQQRWTRACMTFLSHTGGLQNTRVRSLFQQQLCFKILGYIITYGEHLFDDV